MSQGAPVQEIEIETIRDDRGKPWILNNMALAVYAKLGGIPWVLTSTPGMTHELIFGIGSARIQTKRLSESERVVGITTVFNGDGNYLLYNVSKDVPYEEYQSTLLQSLKDCLEEIKARYGWQPGDNVRLIFHQSFKKYRDVEAQAVKKFVQSITDFNVEYAFVHISTTHQWNIFDTQSDGADYWENYKKFVKGKYVPMRGYCIPLGPQTALLTLTGPQQLKTHLQGCPDPILISIHRESTFTSQEYLISQIYKFTFMSWKSFFPSTMPVTIAYSDMIANLMGQLKPVQNWNPEILTTKLRESRWFL
jgi:argonaute-like protein implicated in RNA metabolism and viral defense